MIRLNGFSIVTFGAVLSMTAGVAFAGDTVSADKILKALKPTSPTRGLSVGPQVDTAAQAKEASFVATLRNRKTRSLSLGERQEMAEHRRRTSRRSTSKSASTTTRPTSARARMPAVDELGKALSDPQPEGLDLRGRRSYRRGRR